MAGYIGKTLPIATVTTTEPGLDLLEAETKQEQRDLLELGTASQSDVTTSNTDTTANRLLKVGDFGLGREAPSITDANLQPAGSMVRILSPWNNVPLAQNGSLLSYGQENFRPQFFVPNGNPGIYFRQRLGTVWTPWREIYHTGNILGTVSQSAGVPTGAIIERGSNANGEFVKYADGTQICTKVFLQNDNRAFTDRGEGFFRTEGVAGGSTAANFVQVPTIFVFGYREGTVFSWGIGGGNVGVTHSFPSVVAVASNTGGTSPVSLNGVAIGRWY